MLATLLGHHRTTLDTIPRALEIYDSIRQPFATKVAERSRLNGHYFSFHGMDCDSSHQSEEVLRDKLQSLAGTFTRNWEWCWSTSVDGSMKEAINLLECS